MNDKELLEHIERQWHGNHSSYILGLLFSFILTLFAFLLVGLHLFSPRIEKGLVFGLAIIQATVQLYYFLHLGKDEKPRLRTLLFIFMVFVLLILVFGSLWIMYNLQERMGM